MKEKSQFFLNILSQYESYESSITSLDYFWKNNVRVVLFCDITSRKNLDSYFHLSHFTTKKIKNQEKKIVGWFRKL